LIESRNTFDRGGVHATFGTHAVSVGFAHCRTFARGPPGTLSKGWSSLACTPPNSVSRKTSTTFERLRRREALRTRSPLTTTARSGVGWHSLLAGALLHRCDRAGARSPLRRRQLRRIGNENSPVAGSSRKQRRDRSRVRFIRGAWSRSGRGLGQLEVARNMRWPSQSGEVRVSWRCCGAHASPLRHSPSPAPQSMGAVR
jgi:hypothetical protein